MMVILAFVCMMVVTRWVRSRMTLGLILRLLFLVKVLLESPSRICDYLDLGVLG